MGSQREEQKPGMVATLREISDSGQALDPIEAEAYLTGGL
jgi:hypothetical protein